MTDYELTRRDALAALAAAGVSTTSMATYTSNSQRQEPDGPLTAHERETLLAVARTVYPPEVSGIPEFVERYVVARVVDRPERLDGITAAISDLDDWTESWYDSPFADLDPERRDEALRRIGVDQAEPVPDPDGHTPGIIRFFLVNELLFALFTTPTGGKLVGLGNPQGYPGGTGTYQQGPGE